MMPSANAEVGKRTTRKDVDHRHSGAAGFLIRLRERGERDAGHRNVRTQAIQGKDGQRKQNLVTQLLNLECFYQGT
jgi:hypothetical protein